MRSAIVSTVTTIALAALSGPLSTANAASAGHACSQTTRSAFTACQFDNLDNFWIADGKCRNIADSGDREDCFKENRSALKEGRKSCGEVRDARADLCDDLGEAPYDPAFEPSQFVNPADIGGSVAPNPYFPLIRGRSMIYRSATENVTVTITDEVKLFNGVPCAVVLDNVVENGQLTEGTTDWFAQDIHGNVWYCGENTQEFVDGLPVNMDGSFQAGTDGAKPGIVMKAAPMVGDVYRQEFDLGNAEDAAEIVSLAGSATTPVASCASTCLVTEETTALEPDALENKFYRAGVGFILQINVGTGERSELVQVIDH